MNVLVLGSRIIGSKLAEDLVKAFLGAKFTNEERHVRRLNKVKALEAKFAAGLKQEAMDIGVGARRAPRFLCGTIRFSNFFQRKENQNYTCNDDSKDWQR